MTSITSRASCDAKNLNLPTIYIRRVQRKHRKNCETLFWIKQKLFDQIIGIIFCKSNIFNGQAWLIFRVSPSQPHKPQFVMSSTWVSAAKKCWLSWLRIYLNIDNRRQASKLSAKLILPTDTFAVDGSWMEICGKRCETGLDKEFKLRMYWVW